MSALARADAICTERGGQLTPLRRAVLQELLEAEVPMGAYALLDRLRTTRTGAAPPTVYRALDFLMSRGLVHRIERLNAFLPCSSLASTTGHAPHDHDRQFLICGRCGAATELQDPAVTAALAASAARAGFVPHNASVEVTGICAGCRGR